MVSHRKIKNGGVTLIKNRKHVVCIGMLSLVFVLSALAVLSPLVRAEESPKYTWRDITIPGQGNISESRVSLDGSKLFVLRKNLSGGGALVFWFLWTMAQAGILSLRQKVRMDC